jgi:hypothetical protein
MLLQNPAPEIRLVRRKKLCGTCYNKHHFHEPDEGERNG